jgi:hypothetical protein
MTFMLMILGSIVRASAVSAYEPSRSSAMIATEPPPSAGLSVGGASTTSHPGLNATRKGGIIFREDTVGGVIAKLMHLTFLLSGHVHIMRENHSEAAPRG